MARYLQVSSDIAETIASGTLTAGVAFGGEQALLAAPQVDDRGLAAA